jgi:hypothetical protein
MINRIVFAVFALLLSLVSAGTNEEGLKFLAAKEKDEGVIKLPSGLLYKGVLLLLLVV